ncbi:MAG TPA: carboxypeptidase regulatory-like domain-containing protein [Kutzneria sp.]|jgi:hypothetical protein
MDGCWCPAASRTAASPTLDAASLAQPGAPPIPGATVQIDTWAASYTLKTDAGGNYLLWLDNRNNPLTLIVARNGWQPQTRQVKITKGRSVTADFALKPVSC